MGLPSFNDDWVDGRSVKPRILVLEVRRPDRPEKGPVAWLVVERNETSRRDDTRDGSVYEASIELSYRCIPSPFFLHDGLTGRFNGSYSKVFGSVSLTSSSLASGGAVFLDLPGLEGHRIGTYLMNEIVMWAQRWPEAMVNTIHLLPHQAEGRNKDRRNRFYEQFGLVFDYSDAEHREGFSRPILAKELTPVETWKINVTEHRMLDYLAKVLYAEKIASSELELRTRAVKSLSDDLRNAYAHPMRWLITTLYGKYVGSLSSAAILMVFLALAWLSFR